MYFLIFCLKIRHNILLIGLDNSGKTTLCQRILQHFNQQSMTKILPTIGLQTYQFQIQNQIYNIIDMGGNAHSRGLWSQYTSGATEILIVIDGNEQTRYQCLKNVLQEVQQQTIFNNQKIFIISNKSDLKSVTSQTLNKNLNFQQIFRQYSIQTFDCSALKDDNVQTIVDQLK